MPEPPPTRVLSVNVSLARTAPYRGHSVTTGIYKMPVEGRVHVGRLGLTGDQQADLRVHGGVNKAVYAYPSEHYEIWRGELPGMEFSWGFFGENLTTAGLGEAALHIGDRLRVGTAVLEVTKPRFPCFKLAMKAGHADFIDRFLDSGRSGFYSSVVEEGEVTAGDRVERLHVNPRAPTIAEIVRSRIREQGEE